MQRIIIGLLLSVPMLALVGVTSWLLLRGASPVSAEQAMESACANLAAAKDYDFTSTATGSQDGVDKGDTLLSEYQMSGDNYYAQVKLVNSGVGGEFLYVDGNGYQRDAETNYEWQPAYLPLLSGNEILTMLGDTPTCPDLTNVTKVGDEVLNGVAATKYTSGDGKPAPLAADFRGSKRGDLFEYWVDGRGQLLQIYNENYIAAHYEGSAEGKTTGVYRITTTFAEVGEANTITAPTLGQ